MEHTSTFAKWLAGLSGAAVVLAFAYYMQAYLSILSIKDDCAARQFVADAIRTTTSFVIGATAAGLLALAAVGYPTVVRARRNRLRRMKGKPPLRPGQEFDGLSEFQVYLIWQPQALLVLFSTLLLVALIWFLIWFGLTIGGKPEGVQKMWHEFELRCLQQPPVQGAS